jgi:hypothetical protein
VHGMVFWTRQGSHDCCGCCGVAMAQWKGSTMALDATLLAAVETAKTALDQAVSAEAAAAGVISTDQAAVTAAQAKVAAAQSVLDAATAQVTTDQAADTAALSAIKADAQALDTALQALIASLP